MEHIHTHNHTHDHGEAFAPAAENLLLDLAAHARAGHLPDAWPHDVTELDEHEDNFGVAHIKARLGDAYPALSLAQESAVLAAFNQQYDALPTSHPRFEHAHGNDGCGKPHGPVRRVFESMEHKMLGRIRNQRVKLVAAMAFRGSSLVLCPGDDLAAMGLQLYGAFTGHTGHDDHAHAEHMAILPRRPSIETRMGRATLNLPLDGPPHEP